MPKRILQSTWFKYLTELLTLTLALGILFGVVSGLMRGWKYIPEGLFLITLDTLNISVNESIYLSFLFLVFYLLVFLSLRRLIENIKLTCFVVGAISCLPFFLFWGYKINQSNWINWFNFFGWQAIILNVKIALGFTLLWILASLGLFFWTKTRILNSQFNNIRLPSSLLLTVLVFNISIYLFNNLHASKQNSPNVIVILIDTLRADHLSLYGYSRNTTPNIDEFSKNAVVFTQAISQATFTKTSIASLFTSLNAYQHGVYRGAGDLKDTGGSIATDVLDENETTLAEVLLQNKFLTTAWLQQGQLASYMGFAQGFINYNERQNDIKNINGKFIKWLKRSGKKRKFFAYIHYLDLHDPYRPQPPYDTLYFDNTRAEKIKSRDKFRAYKQRAFYDGQLTYIDSEIGLLFEQLKKTDFYEDTLIILTADHGEAFGEHGFFKHSYEPYDELIRVPLIIKFPKSLYAGEVVKSQVRLIDVMPTILDFLKIKTDSELEGSSLLSHLNNGSDRNHKMDFPDHAVSEIFNERYGVNALSIRTEKFKYIHFHNRKDELYDLEKDPEERDNVIGLNPEVAEKFQQMLQPVLSEKKQKVVKKVNLSEETVNELKALGYIE